jgi:hypothetical protein
MDPILAAQRLPRIAERAMRDAAVVAAGRGRRVTPRVLINDALIRFERSVQRVAGEGIRPSLLFAERDRIVSELRRFIETRLAARLFALRRRDVLAVGAGAAPFDAIVRGKRGGSFGVVFRRLAKDGRRLETMRAMRTAAHDFQGERLTGILVYDFTTAAVRTLRCGNTTIELHAA